MKTRRTTTSFIFLLFLVFSSVARVGAQDPMTGPEAISLKPDIHVIRADGSSTATITVQVFDRKGDAVPDGVVVRFTATMGSITPTATTRRGIAQATLRSSGAPGQAEIEARAGDRAVGRCTVEFASEVGVTADTAPYVRLEAQGIQFFPEQSLMDAAGTVHLSYRGIQISAGFLQLHVGTLSVRAREQVRLTVGSRELTADLLTVDLQQLQGALTEVGEGSTRRERFQGYELSTWPMAPEESEGLYEFVEVEQPKSVMTARKVTLFPGDRIQFSGFSLIAGGIRVVRLPHYVLSLNPYSRDADQYLSVDSVGGVSVNLPFYYSMNETSNGSLRLRRFSRYSYDGYNTRPGWHLALLQRYDLGQRMHGSFELNHITSKDWGLRWQHEQRFKVRTHSYVSVDAPAHKDVYARAELYHSMGIGDLNLSSYGSFLPDAPDSFQSRLHFRLKPGTIKGPNIRYYWSANVAWLHWNGRSETEQGVDLQIHPPSISLTPSTRLQFYTGGGYTVAASGTGPTAQASAAITQQLGKSANATLRYSYYASGRRSEFYGPTSTQSITAQLYATPSRMSGDGTPPRWSTALTGTLSPDTGALTAYGSLIYSPLRYWRLELRPTYSRIGGAVVDGYARSTTNLDIYLAREIGGRDVALRWSTLDRRIRFEMATTALRF